MVESKQTLKKLIEVSFYGDCHVRACGVGGAEIKSAKHRAMIALLATAYEGRRSRRYLQETLWSSARHDGGSQSLRRALSDLRNLLGKKFYSLFEVSNSDISIALDKIEHLTDRNNGEFLEGLSVKEQPFQDWLERYRSSPAASLKSTANAVVKQIVQPNLNRVCVAVVPFRVIYGDRKRAIVGDVIAEDISRALSRSHLLSVISPLSMRQFTRQELSLINVKKQLKADYVVLGSIRFSRDMVSLDVDFMDTISGHLHWTRQFEWLQEDQQLYDPVVIEEVSQNIGRTVVNETINSIGSSTFDRIEDHRLLVAGISLMHKQSFSGFLRSKVMLQEVLNRNPHHPEVYSWMAKWYIMRVLNGWSINRNEDCNMAKDYSNTALELAPESAFALTIDGFVHNNLLQELDVAKQRYELALSINSNESLSWLLNGTLLSFQGDTAEAVRQVEKAHRLSPLDPFGYFFDSLRASTHLSDGQFEKALELADRSYANNPRHSSTLRVKIAALDALKRHEQAMVVARDLMKNEPHFSVADYLEHHPAARFDSGKMMAAALIKSGIPEK